MSTVLPWPARPVTISHLIQSMYDRLRGVEARIVRWRPFICPFEEILARVPRGARVLDVGCGIGLLSSVLAVCRAPRQVFGIDVSEPAIEKARTSRVCEFADLRFECLPAFGFPADTFDVVLCIDVLHHVPPADQWRFLELVCQRVQPGGLLLFKDISPRPRWKALMNRLHDLVMARQWVNYRGEHAVADWLRQHSGEVSEEARLDRLWYGHYLVSWKKNL
jgi:2-polyprenyl-3-methyl-5-hydroxy-6-metoxy-1,4-benzoquinol methylase